MGNTWNSWVKGFNLLPGRPDGYPGRKRQALFDRRWRYRNSHGALVGDDDLITNIHLRQLFWVSNQHFDHFPLWPPQGHGRLISVNPNNRGDDLYRTT